MAHVVAFRQYLLLFHLGRENRIPRHHPSICSARIPLVQSGHCGSFVNNFTSLDAFVSSIYLPHVKLRKRSWRVNERIARQHLSPTFGARELADIKRHEVEDWPRPPATAFWPSSRQFALWPNFMVLCLPDNRRARAFRPSKSTHSGNAISRGMRHNDSCGH